MSLHRTRNLSEASSYNSLWSSFVSPIRQLFKQKQDDPSSSIGIISPSASSWSLPSRKVLIIILLVAVMVLWILLKQPQQGNNSQEKLDESSLPTTPIVHKQGKQVLFGYFRCNKYYKTDFNGKVDKKLPKNTEFSMCKVENLCMTQGGKFILFTDRNRLHSQYVDIKRLKRNPWFYTQGRYETDRGDFAIDLVSDGDLEVEWDKGKFVGALRVSNLRDRVELSPSFRLIEEPVFALHRYASGNAGHMLTESLQMIVSLMMGFDEVSLNNHILFLEDVKDETNTLHNKNNWISNYNYPKEETDRISIESAQLLSRNDILQLCRNDDGNFNVVNAPCRNSATSVKSKNDKLEVCFSNFYGGFSVSNLENPKGREIVYTYMRKLAFDKLKLPLVENLFLKKQVHVAIHKKPLTARHGAIIWNAGEVLEHLSSRLPSTIEKGLSKTVQIEFVNLESMSMTEQVEYFSKVDVYISDQGSASYIAIFMRDDSTLIQAPSCFSNTDHKKRCERFFTRNLSHLTNVHVLNVLDLLGEEDSAQKTPMQCNPRPLPDNTENCDPILPLDSILDATLAAIHNKYRSQWPASNPNE